MYRSEKGLWLRNISCDLTLEGFDTVTYPEQKKLKSRLVVIFNICRPLRADPLNELASGNNAFLLLLGQI